LRDHLAQIVREHADRVLGSPHPRRLRIDDAAVGDDEVAGAGNARSFEEARGNRVAQGDIDEPGAARDGDARDPGAQDLLRIPRRPEGAVARIRRASRTRRRGALREPKRQMAVAIDEPGHDPVPGGVDDAYRTPILDADVLGQPPDAANAAPLDDDGVVRARRASGAVDQRAVTNDERSRVLIGHLSLLPRQGLSYPTIL